MAEIGVAVVVPRDPSAPPGLDALRSHARERLAAFKLPEDLRIVDEIPVTAMDKVDRRALRASLVSEDTTERTSD
jgi:acyl-CoA synthetase (AMP-forming)/AMP-acid ligase II